MAVSITPNLTELYDCDSTTNWSPTPTTNTEVQVEGTACNSLKVSQATTAMLFTLGSAVDLQNTHIFAWMMSTTVTGLDTKANGGLRIRVEDASANFGEWYVGGKDTYSGGFKNFVVDTARTFDNKSATAPNLAAITKVGVTFKVTAMSSAINCFWDIARYGTGLTIGGGTDGDPGTWQNIADSDASNANAYGIVRTEGGVFFVSGALTFGDGSGTTSTVFKDTGKIVVFEDKPVASTLYKITIVGNSIGTNKFQLGTVVGSGDDRQGVAGGTIQVAGTTLRVAFDSETDSADVNEMFLYGVSFKRGGIMQMAGSTTQDIIGCTFENCDEIQPNNAEFIANTIIGPPSVDDALEMLSTHQIQKVNFIAETGGATEHHLHIPNAGTYTANALKFFGFGAAGSPDWHGKNNSGGQVTINATAGSTVTENEMENVGGGSATTVNNNVNTKVIVKDEAGAFVIGAQVSVRKASDNTEVFGGTTNASGEVTGSAPSNTGSVRVRVRKGSGGGTDYVPVDSPQTIGATDFSVTITLAEDTINAS